MSDNRIKYPVHCARQHQAPTHHHRTQSEPDREHRHRLPQRRDQPILRDASDRPTPNLLVGRGVGRMWSWRGGRAHVFNRPTISTSAMVADFLVKVILTKRPVAGNGFQLVEPSSETSTRFCWSPGCN